MKILALDQATKCGWATDTSSGMWDLKARSGESVGMRVVRFKSKVKEIIEADDIQLIAYERPSGRNIRAIQVASEMVGVIITLCNERGIEYASYSPGEVKRFATGKGNCNKDDMVEAAEKKWPHIDIIDDNHADALWILALTKKDVNG